MSEKRASDAWRMDKISEFIIKKTAKKLLRKFLILI